MQNRRQLLEEWGNLIATGLRQFVPWHFVGEPACYVAGRYVRVEAVAFPTALAQGQTERLPPYPTHRLGG